MSRHRFDPISFLFGAMFMIIAVGALSGTRVGEFSPEAFWSLSIVAVGVALVLWALFTIAHRDRPAIVADADGSSAAERPPEIPSSEDEADDYNQSGNSRPGT